MQRTTYISAGAHALLIGWAILGGVFRSDPPPMNVAEVSVLSEEEFAALTALSQPPESTTEVLAPPAPEPEADAPAPPAPTPDPEPVAQPEPPAPPEPEPETPPEPVAPPAPPEAEVTDVPPVLEAPPVPDIAAPETVARPVPRPAPRVAPDPVAPPEPDTAVAAAVQVATEPDPEATDVAEPVEEDTAPEAATTEIVTEAEEPAAAPTASLRPRTRPARPTPAETPTEETAEAPTADSAGAPADDTAAAVADAVAAAISGGTTDPAPDLPEGPPMTRGEREALRVAVQACWVVDVGSQAANVTVTVGMQMERNGRVVPGSLTMLGSEGGSGAAVQTAFQAARRAILRCQGDGYDLPEEKYAQWREIEIVFNPSEMRLR